MWPFSSSDDGCGSHHFGEYEPTDDLKTEVRTYYWRNGEYKGWYYSRPGKVENEIHVNAIAIMRKYRKKCQHHGCYETKTVYRTERVVPEDRLDGVGIDHEEMKESYGPESDV